MKRFTTYNNEQCIKNVQSMTDDVSWILYFTTGVLQAGAYYLGMLAYYWVLATPAVGFLFGCYLYIAVNWFHVHYDEAFSALRIPNFKGFSRLHINTQGDLEIYGLAMDKVMLLMLLF